MLGNRFCRSHRRLDIDHAGVARVAVLDRFFAFTGNGLMGWDFFLAPRAIRNLLAGNSIFLTEISDYGPYATCFVQHPFLAVAVGP